MIVDRSEAYDSIRLFHALDETTIDTEIRRELDNTLVEEWSYSQIDKLSKGNKIKNWAKKMAYTCPGAYCNHIIYDSISHQILMHFYEFFNTNSGGIQSTSNER